MGPGSKHRLSPLYWGPNALEEEERILRALRDGKPLFGLYLITLSTNPVEQLDILPSYFLVQPAVRRTLPPVVGVAKGREEAFSLIETIAAEAFRETGTVSLRTYLQDKIPAQSGGTL